MAVARIRTDGLTPRYIARGSGEGMSKKESRRCRKHYLTRAPPYPLILADLNVSAPSAFQRRFNARRPHLLFAL